MSNVARSHAHAVGVAVEDERTLSVSRIVRRVATRVKPGIGEEVAFDALDAARRQCTRDLGDVAGGERWIAAAAQHYVAVNNAVGVRLGPVERRVIAEVGPEIGHGGGGGEDLGVRRRVELHRGVVREQDVAVRRLHHLHADLGPIERRLTKDCDQPVA